MTVQGFQGARGEERESRIRALFSRISPTYDRVNTLLSCAVDRLWRERAVTLGGLPRGGRVLDCGTGTGEMALLLARRLDCRVTAIDFAPSMIRIAEEKVRKAGYGSMVTFLVGNIRRLPFPDKTFDGVTMAFLLRNLPFLPETLDELRRVLAPGGRLILLELTKPRHPLLRTLYFAYLERLLPFVGGAVSGEPEAYRYLARSIRDFYEPEELVEVLAGRGFTPVAAHPLTGGIASVFTAGRPSF